jgi:PAS domain S-box-containing protein
VETAGMKNLAGETGLPGDRQALQPASTLFADAARLAQAIAEATDDVIFAKDLQSRYQFANPATLAAVGCTLEQVIGRTDLDFMQDQVVARRLMENDRAVVATGRVVEAEEPVLQPDGTLRYWSSRKMPLRDGGGQVIGVLGIARDITQRKTAEARMEADHLKLEMGIQAAGLVMAEIDYRTGLNHISAELARLMELGEAEMTVPRQAIFDRIHPEDRDRYLRSIAEVLQPTSNGHLAIDVRAQLPGGGVRWLHIRLQIVFETAPDGQRQPVRGICAARDVTAERVAEDKLIEADRRKDEFIATLAHELRNPLAPIRNGLEILRRLDEMPPVARRTRDMMERQLVHLVRLVDDLLDVSRISRDRLDLRIEPLTLEQVVTHAVEASQPGVEAAGHQLEVRLPPGPVPLRGDLTRLAQVLSNLVNNAAKYTPRGGLIVLRGEVRQDHAVLQVTDTGAGIPADLLPQVFELFAQGEGTRSSAQGGLGIGLWLVRKLVELHHGSVQAHSEGPGRGSTFSVRLPLARDP